MLIRMLLRMQYGTHQISKIPIHELQICLKSFVLSRPSENRLGFVEVDGPMRNPHGYLARDTHVN